MDNSSMNMLENLKSSRDMQSISFDVVNVLKLPVIAILFGNLLYAFILILRIRILADTFESTNNNKIKTIAYIYLLLTLIGTLFALLLIVLG